MDGPAGRPARNRRKTRGSTMACGVRSRAKEAPEVEPTPGYSGRRRAGSREPDGGKERGDTAGGKPDDDGFVVI